MKSDSSSATTIWSTLIIAWRYSMMSAAPEVILPRWPDLACDSAISEWEASEVAFWPFLPAVRPSDVVPVVA